MSLEEDKIEINDGHYLELMDRLHVLSVNFQEHITEHPLVSDLDDRELNTSIRIILSSLGRAYQRVGQLDYENNYNEEDKDVE